MPCCRYVFWIAPWHHFFLLEKGVHSQWKWKCKGIIFLSLFKSSIQSCLAALTRQDHFPTWNLGSDTHRHGTSRSGVKQHHCMALSRLSYWKLWVWLAPRHLLPLWGRRLTQAFWLKGMSHLLEDHHSLLVSQKWKPAQAFHVVLASAPGSECQGDGYPVWGEEATGHLEVFILGNTYTSGHCQDLCANETLLIWNSGIFMSLPSSYFL